jgi:hypothetical protein
MQSLPPEYGRIDALQNTRKNSWGPAGISMAKQANTKSHVSKAAADQCPSQLMLWWDEEIFYMKGGTGFSKQELHPPRLACWSR